MINEYSQLIHIELDWPIYIETGGSPLESTLILKYLSIIRSVSDYQSQCNLF
jgi:hypothetical protein